MDNNYYFKPYEGEEPFVFISYAHADSSQVMPIIADMNKCGFRVWYDEGIEAGSMWTECIADHLTRASLVLGFISNSYMASENCKREMNFAVQKRKKLINIFLSPTELTPGMDLQIGGIWALMKYTFPNDNHFFMKLYEAPLLYSEDFGVAKPEELKIAEADDKKAGEANSYRAQIINEEKEKGSILEKSKSGVQKEKRKKSKKTLIIVLSILLLLVAGSVGFWITGRATGVTGRLYNRFLRIEFPIKTLAPETEAKFKNPIIEKAEIGRAHV